MQITCPQCGGKGLVGQGPTPQKLEGRPETCPDCAGTGKIDEKEPAEDDQWTPVADAPVDNVNVPKKYGGILKWIFHTK